MKKNKILIITALLLGLNVNAQKIDSLENRPGQVTFFYPVGTNGLAAPNYSNTASINLINGINGGLTGVEFGGIVNTNLGNVSGAQFAGIANITTGKTNGAIFAGICNIQKDSSTSASFAGITNIINAPAIGGYFSGISNVINGSLTGASFAGIANITNGNSIGAQFAGISNLNTGNFIGLQLAGIHNSNKGDIIGVQIGLINKAKNITGVQFGFINIADSFEKGVPFGFINFVKNGFHAIEISGGEAIYGNFSFKMGVDKLYTIYKVGYASNNTENYLMYGLGFGTMLSIDEKSKISIDLSANHLIKQSFSPKLDLLSRADFAYRYHFNSHLAVFGGPAFNVYLSEDSGDLNNAALNVPYTLYKQNWWNNEGNTSIWIGANIGVSFGF